jgi:hypothetical protein
MVHGALSQLAKRQLSARDVIQGDFFRIDQYNQGRLQTCVGNGEEALLFSASGLAFS